MASSTTTAIAPTFHFRLTTPPSHPKPRLSLLLLSPKPIHPSSVFAHTNHHPAKPTAISHPAKSIDVSKEDKPTSDPTNPPTYSESDPNGAEPTPKFDKRRLEEKFAVLNTGIYDCRSCGFTYDEATGDPSYPIPPGLRFAQLPEDWRCPTCGAAKSFFESKSVEIAGFAQNQQFGLGGNALTSGQKIVLIYGSLAFFFMLFLSGYFLQ